MIKRRMVLAGLCAFGLGFGSAWGQDDPAKTLAIGDEAPAIEISHWIKGTPVEKFEPGQIYVMEFWATWCGPCRTSMPHISEIQEEYPDQLQVVSVSDEELSTVVGFMVQADADGTQWFDKMRYTVATDPDRSVYQDYMKAAGQRGIPTAFIVGRTGKIEWIGHPMRMDDPIKAIVNDEWDRAAYAQQMVEARKSEKIFQSLMRNFGEAQAEGNLAQAVKLLDEVIELGEQYEYMQRYKFQLMVSDADNSPAGYAFGTKLAEENWDDPQLLNGMAWFVVDEEDLQNRDFDFAMRIAKRACELTDFADAAILDTYARVYYEQGDLQSALKWQRQAVAQVTEGPMAEGVKETLVQYEKEAEQN